MLFSVWIVLEYNIYSEYIKTKCPLPSSQSNLWRATPKRKLWFARCCAFSTGPRPNTKIESCSVLKKPMKTLETISFMPYILLPWTPLVGSSICWLWIKMPEATTISQPSHPGDEEPCIKSMQRNVNDRQGIQWRCRWPTDYTGQGLSWDQQDNLTGCWSGKGTAEVLYNRLPIEKSMHF